MYEPYDDNNNSYSDYSEGGTPEQSGTTESSQDVQSGVTASSVEPADEAKPVGGEYHFTGDNLASEEPEPRQSYSDAGYEPSDSASVVPPRYHCGTATQSREQKEKKEKKSKRGIGAGALIAACLVCAILGGIGGGAVMGAISNRTTEQSVSGEAAGSTDEAGSSDSETVLTVASPSSTTTVSTTVVASGDTLTASEIYELAKTQVVGITTEITYTNYFGYTSSSAVSGSGFIISENGYILTNYHVIETANEGGYDISVLTYDGTEYTAEIVGYEEDNDVAVLKIEAEGLSPVTLGDSNSMVVGEQVYAVGNPLGELEYTMTGGMVSALDREITTTDSSTGSSTTINMFQFDAAVNSGNSGGPVYNSRGEVIGIVTAKYSDSGVEGLGFAIPINDAVSIANDLMTTGYVTGKAYMGIRVETVNSTIAQYYNMVEGAYVYSVEEDSCAETAGLKTGDIIVAIDDTEISSSSDLVSAKRDYSAGDTASLRVYRSGEYLDLSITFDEEVPDTSDSETTTTEESDSQSDTNESRTETDMIDPNSIPSSGGQQFGGRQGQ